MKATRTPLTEADAPPAAGSAVGLSAQKLSPGRHPLPQKVVVESQRTRLLDAVSSVVALKGYNASTVADVIALAGVSRRTFYELFPNIEDCFIAAYESGMYRLFGAIRAALQDAPPGDWRVRTELSIEAYLQALSVRPDAAWAYTIEVVGAGRKVLQRRAWVMAQWVGQWRALHAIRRRAEPATPKMADAHWLALVGGIEELVRECLQTQGAAGLPELAAPATRFALTLLEAGVPPAAARA